MMKNNTSLPSLCVTVLLTELSDVVFFASSTEDRFVSEEDASWPVLLVLETKFNSIGSVG